MSSNKSLGIFDFLFFAILILSPFGNLKLQDSILGVLGAFAPTVFVFLYCFVFLLYSIAFGKIRVSFLILILYFSLISLFYVFFIEFNGSDFFVSGIKFFIIYISFLCLIYFPNVDKKFIFYAVLIASLICVASLFFGHDIYFINYLPHEDDRPKGFTMESSHLALISGCLSTFGFSLSKNKLSKLFFIISGLFVIFMTESKAGLVFYFLSLFFYILAIFLSSNHKRNKFIILFFIFVFCWFLFFYIFPYVEKRIINDIENYTSTATRFSGVFVSFYSLFSNPLGVGFFGYHDSFLDNSLKSISLLKLYFPYWDFSEIYGYVIQEGFRSVSTKSFFFDGLIFGGLFFLFIYISGFSWLILKSITTRVFKYIPVILFIFFSMTFWNSLISFYVVFLILSFIINDFRSNRVIE